MLCYQNTTTATWPDEGQMICLVFYPRKNVIASSSLSDGRSVPALCLSAAHSHLPVLPWPTACCSPPHLPKQLLVWPRPPLGGGTKAPGRERGMCLFALLSPPCNKTITNLPHETKLTMALPTAIQVSLQKQPSTSYFSRSTSWRSPPLLQLDTDSFQSLLKCFELPQFPLQALHINWCALNYIINFYQSTGI